MHKYKVASKILFSPNYFLAQRMQSAQNYRTTLQQRSEAQLESEVLIHR